MISHTLAGTMFSLQTSFGILANFSFLYHYAYLCFTGFRFKSIDIIIQHLTISNSLIMLSKGISQTVIAFGVKHSLPKFVCIAILYVYRVSRSVSIGTTCILSVFQAIKISPMVSCCKEIKTKAPKYVDVSILLCWVLYIWINLIFPVYTHSKLNLENITWNRDSGYCFAGFPDGIGSSLYIVLVLLPEVSCSGIMLWSSSTMICILRRHRTHMQYIHKARLSSRPSPEAIATQIILTLVCTFVSFYTISSTIYAYIAVFNISSTWLMNTSALISTCFPTISPLILLNHGPTVTSLWTKFKCLTHTKFVFFFTNFRFIQREVGTLRRNTQSFKDRH